jgi:hypothetical protein
LFSCSLSNNIPSFNHYTGKQIIKWNPEILAGMTTALVETYKSILREVMALLDKEGVPAFVEGNVSIKSK